MNLARRMLAAGLLGRKQAPVEPVASDVSISGYLYVGETLTGSYTYSDPDGSAEGTSTFRWLRDGVAIDGATGETYELVEDDEGADITFEVTPVSVSEPTTGTPVVSDAVGPVGPPPLLVDDCEVAWTGVTGLPSSATVSAGGSGYTVGDILAVSGGDGMLCSVTTVDGSGAVLAAGVLQVGFGGYTSGAKATTGGTGSGCTISPGSIKSATCTLESGDIQVGAGAIRMTPSGIIGKAALLSYRAIGPLDLAGFTKLRFWYKGASALSNENRISIVLCSDAAARVIVDEIKVPAGGGGSWTQAEAGRVGGGALGGAIASIGLFSGTSGMPNFSILFDDIWAIA